MYICSVRAEVPHKLSRRTTTGNLQKQYDDEFRQIPWLLVVLHSCSLMAEVGKGIGPPVRMTNLLVVKVSFCWFDPVDVYAWSTGNSVCSR